jgi:hypothetical protein
MSFSIHTIYFRLAMFPTANRKRAGLANDGDSVQRIGERQHTGRKTNLHYRHHIYNRRDSRGHGHKSLPGVVDEPT